MRIAECFTNCFRSAEVKAVLYALNHIHHNLSSLGWYLALPMAKKLALQEHTTREAVIIKKIPPYVFAMNLLFSATSSMLASGQYHTYRGVLSQQGRYLNEVWLELLALLEDESYFSSEDADKLAVSMTDKIAQMG